MYTSNDIESKPGNEQRAISIARTHFALWPRLSYCLWQSDDALQAWARVCYWGMTGLPRQSASSLVDIKDRREAFEAHIYSPAHLLARADQLVNAGYLEHCRAAQTRLTLPQLLYLCAVAANPGCHQAAAARMVGMDTPTGALVISALERKGFVQRRPSATDKRRKMVLLTQSGDAEREAGLEHLASATRTVMEPVSAAERLQLQGILERIAEHGEYSAPPLCNADGQPVAVPSHLPPDVLPGYLLGRCLQIAAALVAPSLAPFDLTIRQYVVLTMLGILGPCNLTTLTTAMGSERSSLAIVLPSLEERGLINVRRASDRSLTITLAANGLKLLNVARPAAETANERIAIDLSQSERKAFETTLGKILNHHGQLLKFGSIVSGHPAV